jgi:hypothetical protein
MLRRAQMRGGCAALICDTQALLAVSPAHLLWLLFFDVSGSLSGVRLARLRSP